jgi:hypothetical protein
VHEADTERIKTRLTFNYFRKGGYSVGSEDYRWFVEDLRSFSIPDH